MEVVTPTSTPVKTKRGREDVEITPLRFKKQNVDGFTILRFTESTEDVKGVEEDENKQPSNVDDLDSTKSPPISFKNLVINEVIKEDRIISDVIENEIYHYKFQVESFTDVFRFGYSKNENSVEAEFSLRPIRGSTYEIIYDMINNRMSIRQGDNKEVHVCRISSTPVYPFIGCTNASVKYLGCWDFPLTMIKRFIINISNDDLKNGYNEVSYYKYNNELYKYNNNRSGDIIQYVVCNKNLQDRGNGVFNFKINEEMKEKSGIYHFYFQIMSIGIKGISFGFYKNPDSSNELFPCIKLFNFSSQKIDENGKILEKSDRIFGIKGKVYEVIYDMNEKKMHIRQGNEIMEVCKIESTVTFPFISIGDGKGLVNLIEYYIEKENYHLFNSLSVEDGETVLHGIKVPNTINSIYNYEKYYFISELLSIKSNPANIDINTIKDIILSRFQLEVREREYVNHVNSLDDLIILLQYFDDENTIYLDYSDSFVRIVNNLKIVNLNKLVIDEDGKFVENDEKKKYLEFSKANVKVFQFPKNIIYIRDCYYTMFQNICKLISSAQSCFDIVITGQPGIGKTSFIYVLLFFLKNNLSYDYNKDEKKKEKSYLEMNQLNEEKRNIDKLTAKLIVEKNNKIDSLRAEIAQLQLDIKKSNELINGFNKDIETEINRFKAIGDYTDLYTSVGKTHKLKIYDEEREIKTSKENLVLNCQGQFDLNIKELNGKYELKESTENISNDDRIICKCVITERILTRLNNIHSEEKSIELYNKRIGEITREIVGLQTEYEDTFHKIKNTYDQINTDVGKIKDEDAVGVDINDLGIGFNYYILEACKKISSIYFIKGKKDGNPLKAIVYKFENINGEYILFKSAIDPGSIRKSLIIVDTFNYEFNKSNIVISISSPDTHNNDKYKKSRKELYFDCLDITEINEWFTNCIGFDKDADFGKVCERYGNIPRQIYYHYLYNSNYNGDYWIYYKQLIESVVGTTGYSKFVNDYMGKEKLKMNELSNIILKYDLISIWDNELKDFILKPKDYLKFVSEEVEKFIVCKFIPPKDEDEYHKVEEYYTSIKDEYMRRMALKQIIAYELSSGIIKLKCNDFNGGNIMIKNPNFKINSDLYVPSYHPPKALHTVFYILDDNNFFDLIMNGVFIKVLLDGEKLDKGKEFNKNNIPDKIKTNLIESIRKYSAKEDGDFIYCLIEKRVVKCSDIINISNLQSQLVTKKLEEKKEIVDDLQLQLEDLKEKQLKLIGQLKQQLQPQLEQLLQQLQTLQENEQQQQQPQLLKLQQRLQELQEQLQLLLLEEQQLLLQLQQQHLDELNHLEQQQLQLEQLKQLNLHQHVEQQQLEQLPPLIQLQLHLQQQLQLQRKQQLPTSQQQEQLELSEGSQLMDIYIQYKNVYLMRDCFYKMFNFIFPSTFDFNYDNQRNYLIFGHEKIGKTILADILMEIIHDYYSYASILNISKGEGNNPYYDKGNNIQIVISDGTVIGEDDYADAKMIILLANPSKKEYKTFQSKRCPSIMYIPPFTKEEVEKVESIKPWIYYDMDFKGFAYSKRITFGLFTNEGSRYEYREKYPLYKGVIGYYDDDENLVIQFENTITNEKSKVMIEEIIKGIDKSPFSKVEYDRILIYDTYEDENGIFKSNRLIFISEEIKKMVCDRLYKINDKESCERMMKLLKDNPVGSLAGILYERIISFLMKNCNPFYESLINEIKEFEVDERRNKYIVFDKKEIVEVSNDGDLQREIGEFNANESNTIFKIIDLSYNPSFPDIDLLLGPYGIQITVGNSHTLAPEMIMILQNLYRMFFKTSTSINDSSPYGLFYISPNNQVSIKLKANRKISKYPKEFEEMTKGRNKKYLYKEVMKNKDVICYTFDEIQFYISFVNVQNNKYKDCYY